MKNKLKLTKRSSLDFLSITIHVFARLLLHYSTKKKKNTIQNARGLLLKVISC